MVCEVGVQAHAALLLLLLLHTTGMGAGEEC